MLCFVVMFTLYIWLGNFSEDFLQQQIASPNLKNRVTYTTDIIVNCSYIIKVIY